MRHADGPQPGGTTPAAERNFSQPGYLSRPVCVPWAGRGAFGDRREARPPPVSSEQENVA
jgi:hypothetical protein